MKIYPVIYGAIITAILGCHLNTEREGGGASASASAEGPIPEPTIQCAVLRGAWCFLRGPYTLTFFHAQDQPFQVWKVTEQYWSNEPAFVLEDQGCAASEHADTLEVTSLPHGVEWKGEKWRGVFVKLKADGSCNLRLLAPLSDNAPLDMAATVLSTNIAVCHDYINCTPEVVSAKVFRGFKSLQNGGGSQVEK